ncbi:MAG: hypothetical protein E6R03_05270, partial [Hyphomicrobiaceae bacterium]
MRKMSEKEQDIKDLNAGVRKYRAAAKATEDNFRRFNLSGSGCGLCKRYVENRNVGDACGGCPIREASGEASCKNTPYMAAIPRFEQFHSFYDRGEPVGLGDALTRFKRMDEEQRAAFRLGCTKMADYL